ncbi:MAG: DNA starvation/stationary phase protection protein [Deltaproteobacteria bacterium]|nr:DNA starvation/stationary phase protection protein [Deltaproteobacteria bacterium]
MNIGLSENSREGVGTLLNKLLADEFVLYTQTLNYHWNVTGPQFNDLHKFFNSQYEELLEVVDSVAERVRTLGSIAQGALKQITKLARVHEASSNTDKSRVMIINLLKMHESIIGYLRKDLVICDKDFGDAGTSDFLTGLMEKHEKMAWMLRSFLSE